MSALQRLRRDQGPAILAFEERNRAYFARFVNDRGDDYFATFAEQHRAMLAEQQAGVGAYYVRVDSQGAVVGRFNLYRVGNDSAEVGYRVDRRVSGRGVATDGLRDLCRIAREELGLQRLTASVSDRNPASRRVLDKVGFEEVGPTEVGGRPGVLLELVLAGDAGTSGGRREGAPGEPGAPLATDDVAGPSGQNGTVVPG